MNSKRRKISILGTGNVGATIAYTLTLQGICSEIVLVDINKEKAENSRNCYRQRSQNDKISDNKPTFPVPEKFCKYTVFRIKTMKHILHFIQYSTGDHRQSAYHNQAPKRPFACLPDIQQITVKPARVKNCNNGKVQIKIKVMIYKHPEHC